MQGAPAAAREMQEASEMQAAPALIFPGQGDDASPRVGVRALRDLAVGKYTAQSIVPHVVT